MAKNKTAITIALFLMATIAITLVALPTTKAQDHSNQQVPTWTYVGVSPETAGVDEQVTIAFWQNFVPPTANGNFGDRWFFYVDIVTPDLTTETIGPIMSDPVGAGYYLYTPTQVGTYTITARFPGKVLDNTPLGINPSGFYSGSSMGNLTAWLGSYWMPSESEPVTLTVQEESVPYYQETPLPTGYWTRPVYDANRMWGPIMGQWLNSGDTPSRINEYTEGPESSHILWSRPYWAGGVMGGGGNVNFGSYGYYSGQSYENFGGPNIILQGKVYYSVQTPPREGWYCVDLYSGETLYFQNTTGTIGGGGGFSNSGSLPNGAPAYGQVYDYESPNQHGGFPYLWVTSTGKSGTWDMRDGFTGNYICSIANVSSSGTAAVDKTGSIVRYNIRNLGTSANPNYYLQVWNTSQAIWYSPSYYVTSASNSYWMWRPRLNYTYDGNNGFSLNVSIPNVQGSIREVKVDEYIIGGTTGNITGNPSADDKGNFWCLSLKRGEEGKLLWDMTFIPPPGLGDEAIQSMQYTRHDTAFSFLNGEYGVYAFENSMLRIRWVYSLDPAKTGKPAGTLLWESEPEDQWAFYSFGDTVYRGRLYSYGYTGVLLAYNLTTGHIDWNWSAPSVGMFETPYTHTPLSMGCIAEGKLYLYSSEHSVSQPIRRDGKLYCVDAETGQMLWSMTCWPSSAPIIGDGRIVVLDMFDASIYCFGKGDSATTVSAPQNVPTLGSSVMITGTVTDNTPSGRLNTNYGLDFSLKGTPAIADESMDAWMEHLYHQRPIPADAKGVEVILETLDPNGNFYEIGRTTSDINGKYGLKFTPEVPGDYQIIARFEGSASYGSSADTTYLSVDEAPQASPTPAPPGPSMADIYIVPGIIGIIIAIVAVGLVLLLLLRKR
jgi:hypothetical protein